jgi:two-component system chemotaxis response regulator CheY
MAFNILIVDDSASMRKVLRKSIVMCHIGEVNFYEAENGEEALKVLKDEWVDLVFTDINMPIMDGFELVSKLNEDEVHQNTPIVVVTSDTTAENAEAAKRYKIKHIMYKPFRPEAIRELLINLLGLEVSEDGDDSNSEGLDF